MNAYDVKKEMKDAYGVKTKPMRITLSKASYLKICLLYTSPSPRDRG